METSLKTGFAQFFSCCPKKSELPKIWGGCSPPRPAGLYAYALGGLTVYFTTEQGTVRASLFVKWKAMVDVQSVELTLTGP